MLGPGMPARSSVEPAPVADPHRATTSRERPKRVKRARHGILRPPIVRPAQGQATGEAAAAESASHRITRGCRAGSGCLADSTN